MGYWLFGGKNMMIYKEKRKDKEEVVAKWEESGKFSLYFFYCNIIFEKRGGGSIKFLDNLHPCVKIDLTYRNTSVSFHATNERRTSC